MECGLTMGIRALTITVQLECDDYAFSASRGRAKERGLCLGQVSITENTLKALYSRSYGEPQSSGVSGGGW